MASEPAADHLVAGGIDAAAGVAGRDGTHALELLASGMSASEPTASEDIGVLGLACGKGSINDRLGERVVGLGGGASAYGADSAPRRKSADRGGQRGGF